jgi:pimeloyl-ACP methyl ester carboxylesterase
MSSTSIPEGPGSVSGAPNLPEGFADTFTSRYVDAGDVRLHAVIGGDGPPLLLIPIPVLAMGGAESTGTTVEETMKHAADDVQGVVFPGVGHWIAEQAPDELVAALTEFLAPYRDGAVAAPEHAHV